MSIIYHSGYGYSKRICEDVTSWFLTRFFPRHHIIVDVVHRGLKREYVYGYCDYVDQSYRPRHFLIELDTHMCKELYIKTLFHELTHLKQWVDGTLQVRYGKMCYCKEPVEFYAYEDQPHEIEAREQEETLYVEYLFEKYGTDLRETIPFFTNRLTRC
jgi:hypothetical protein